MFGNKKYLAVTSPPKANPKVRAPKPSDEDLPEIPELTTWFFVDHIRNRTEYLGHRVDMGKDWVVIRKIIEQTWQYDSLRDRWVAQPTMEHVASVRAGTLSQWGRA